MRLRMVLSLVVVALIAGPGAGVSTAAGRPVASGTAEASDPIEDIISGEWEGLFEIGGASATLTLKLKLDGDEVTGTAESAHTGPGTVSQGSLVDNKLSFTLNFAAHESIAVAGSLQDGKLSGEFRTEGMVGKWVAKKKAAPVARRGGSPVSAAGAEATTVSPDLIAGEWDATLAAQGTTVPVTFKLKVDGDKVTGTSESAHLGPGRISKGSWAGANLDFTIDGAFGSISISGVLKDGTLVGEFDAGKMHGNFAAKKK